MNDELQEGMCYIVKEGGGGCYPDDVGKPVEIVLIGNEDRVYVKPVEGFEYKTEFQRMYWEHTSIRSYSFGISPTKYVSKKENEMGLNIITEYSGDVITQRVEGADNGISSLTKQVLDLKEEGVRQALIELGWIPPKEVKQIAVIAGSKEEFDHYKFFVGYCGSSPYQLHYIDHVTKVREIRFDDVRMIGTYFKKDNLQELLEAVHSRMKG